MRWGRGTIFVHHLRYDMSPVWDFEQQLHHEGHGTVADMMGRIEFKVNLLLITEPTRTG